LFRLAPSLLTLTIDRRDNNVPKDAASTRSNILDAAVQTLQRGGVEGFTLDAVARRAGVVKGLILYHYASRGRLLRAAASQIAASRSAALEQAWRSAPEPPDSTPAGKSCAVRRRMVRPAPGSACAPPA